MLEHDFFNSFVTVYRPYLKLAEPILEKHQIYYGQWLILRDIAKHQPTTLVEISHRRAIEKPTARKTIKALIDYGYLNVDSSKADKRQKLLSLSISGQDLYTAVHQDITLLQHSITQQTDITHEEMAQTITIMNKIHSTLLGGEQSD
ncbi:MarR family transcriptional regulator [Staphylococcus simiae]|uniref:MarR family winged helix-turn-helix transcriptional regulator n=1 Tax=Staphylococcus simiae TaxID=308354 RepID=UPI001A95E473|nr:MarR family transcriptional regulator [Staphylococcus simiae]MBO1198099.1 MarR family transcriptional regulator [Staphylococcus simiae]MBO1200151.1 MarR family transcriptional regulator [Staphylococcus simiae]MBO1202424.1 MarR family transcriptional regulator [Staphylococcus simiae]MBO1210036.1 MarR family transcriptional regulator [Staphylococcus simiae]MBO1228568.1 MarR family transcriptional regulator [Staphylococcus simiae]